MSPNPAILTWPRPVAGGGGTLSYEYVGPVSSSTSSLVTHTWTDVPIGAAAADRTLVLVVASRYGAGVGFGDDVVEVGGIASTLDAHSNSVYYASIHHIPYPTGATATITVTLGYSNNQGVTVGIYRLTGAPVAVSDTYAGSSPYTASGTVDDVAIAGSIYNAAYTWTGDLTKDYETNTNGWRGSGASSQVAATGTVTAANSRTGCMSVYTPA